MVDMPDHGAAFDQVMQILKASPELVPDAVGHRMVHGGSLFSDHAVVDDEVMADLEEIKDLAPLHNPPALELPTDRAEEYVFDSRLRLER